MKIFSFPMVMIIVTGLLCVMYLLGGNRAGAMMSVAVQQIWLVILYLDYKRKKK